MSCSRDSYITNGQTTCVCVFGCFRILANSRLNIGIRSQRKSLPLSFPCVQCIRNNLNLFARMCLIGRSAFRCRDLTIHEFTKSDTPGYVHKAFLIIWIRVNQRYFNYFVFSIHPPSRSRLPTLNAISSPLHCISKPKAATVHCTRSFTEIRSMKKTKIKNEKARCLTKYGGWNFELSFWDTAFWASRRTGALT